MSKRDGHGVLLLSTGDERKQWLFNLISSIVKKWQGFPIHVLSDCPLDVPYTLIDPLYSFKSRFYKTQLFHYSPFETTIFLDDDILVVDEIEDLHSLLTVNDVAMALDPFANLGLWRDNVVSNFIGKHRAWDEFVDYVNPRNENNPYYNSGVMVWKRTDLTKGLFHAWHERWARAGGGPDQTSLAISLLDLRIQVSQLPSEMNFYPIVEDYIGHDSIPSLQQAKIIHFLSPFGKAKMAEMVTMDAPSHKAYEAHKNSSRTGFEF